MNWIERFNRAVDYIEENLEKPISLQNIADQANSSSFHFQRMFSMLTDITLAEYLRRRRLTKAAGELQQGAGILEMAIKYGYESQASFTRAYSRLFGFSPGLTREPGMKLKAYLPITFQISIKGVHSMDYEIREVGEIRIAGDLRSFTSRDGENFREIPKFWQDVNSTGRMDKIMALSDPAGTLKGSCLGVCMEMSENQEDFNYMIGMEPRAGADLSGLETRTLAPQTWAVFPGCGVMPASIQDVWKRIYGEWFPSMDYEHVNAPEIEVYLPSKEDTPDEIPFEIWIPVCKK